MPPPAAVDPDDVFDMLLGAILARTLVYPVTARNPPVERTVDMVLRLLTPLEERPGVTTLSMPPSRA